MQEQVRDRERQLKESEDIMQYLKQLLKSIDTSSLFEEEFKAGAEGADVGGLSIGGPDFSMRARELDLIAEEGADTSRLTTLEGQQDK